MVTWLSLWVPNINVLMEEADSNVWNIVVSKESEDCLTSKAILCERFQPVVSSWRPEKVF